MWGRKWFWTVNYWRCLRNVKMWYIFHKSINRLSFTCTCVSLSCFRSSVTRVQCSAWERLSYRSVVQNDLDDKMFSSCSQDALWSGGHRFVRPHTRLADAVMGPLIHLWMCKCVQWHQPTSSSSARSHEDGWEGDATFKNVILWMDEVLAEAFWRTLPLSPPPPFQQGGGDSDICSQYGRSPAFRNWRNPTNGQFLFHF